MEPSFKNVEPRTREQRLAALDKEHLEKERLRTRSTRAQEPVYNPLVPVKNSPQYLDDRQRFVRDAAAAEHEARVQTLQQKQMLYERKRAENYWKEKARWDQEAHVSQKPELVWQYKRETCQGGTRRNKSSEDYNIINLHYGHNQEGQALRYKDDVTRYKGQMRAYQLYSKAHSVSHNIITGQPLSQPVLPPVRPVAPWDK